MGFFSNLRDDLLGPPVQAVAVRDVREVELDAYRNYVKANYETKINLLSAEAWEDILGIGTGSKHLTTAEAYRVQAWYRRGTEIRAAALADVPFVITRAGDDEAVVWDSQQHRSGPQREEWSFLAMLPVLLYLSEQALIGEGKAFWLKAGAATTTRRRIDELQWWAPTTVQTLHDAMGAVTGVVRHVGRQTLRWGTGSNGAQMNPGTQVGEREDVVFLRSLSPYVETGAGDPEGIAARINADVLESLDQWLDRHLDGGVIAAHVVATKSKVNETEWERFVSKWQRAYAGAENAGTLINLNAQEAELQRVGGTLADLHESSLTDDQRQAIAAALGVPYSIFTSSAANHATKIADKRDLFEYKVRPQGRMVQLQLNRELFAPLGLQFAFAFHRLEVFQAAEVEKAQSVAQYVTTLIQLRDAGWLTDEQGRAIAQDLLDVPEAMNTEAAAATEALPVSGERSANGQRSFA